MGMWNGRKQRQGHVICHQLGPSLWRHLNSFLCCTDVTGFPSPPLHCPKSKHVTGPKKQLGYGYCFADVSLTLDSNDSWLSRRGENHLKLEQLIFIVLLFYYMSVCEMHFFGLPLYAYIHIKKRFDTSTCSCLDKMRWFSVSNQSDTAEIPTAEMQK